MSARQKYLDGLGNQVRHLHLLELKEDRPVFKWGYFFSKWAVMLYRKFLEDNVKIRAESLAYLMLFSLLPLIAGLFYVFTIFAQFGMVQEAISSTMDRMLSTIPSDHRTMILEYVVKFKDAYLDSISGKSSSLGIFALLILGYVGLQTFNNIDATLNFIWGSETERPFLEKLRNFIVTSVVGPFLIIASLSVPLVLRKLPQTRVFLESVPALYAVINELLPFLLVIGLFIFLYKLVPVRNVSWRAATSGAVVAGIFLQISNWLIGMYFTYGTTSAYGKAAGIPIIGFWIFVVWVIIILGAEVSFLLQNQRFYIREGAYHPSLFETECVLVVLFYFMEAHKKGFNPVKYEQLFNHTRLDPSRLNRILDFLEDEKLIVRCVPQKGDREASYVLAKDLKSITGGDLVKKYLILKRPISDCNGIAAEFEDSLAAWKKELDKIRFELPST
jgi:membrane protein